jgi:hypothetical protein
VSSIADEHLVEDESVWVGYAHRSWWVERPPPEIPLEIT